MKKNTKISCLWIIATVIEWINVILFMAAMGYEIINFNWYVELKAWRHINMLFYVSAMLDATIFYILMLISKKENWLKDMKISLKCCLIQIILVIYKVIL